MFKKFLSQLPTALAITLVFLTVACSHTKRTVSQLEELAPEETEVAASSEASETANFSESVDLAENTVDTPVVEETEAPAEIKESSDEVKTESSKEAEEVIAQLESAEAVPTEEPSQVEMAANDPVKNTEVIQPEVKVEPELGSQPVIEEKVDLKSVKKDLASVTAVVAKKVSPPPVSPKKKVGVEKKPEVREEKPKEELASADMSQLLERNLFWVALAGFAGFLVIFFTVRRNRKSSGSSST